MRRAPVKNTGLDGWASGEIGHEDESGLKP